MNLFRIDFVLADTTASDYGQVQHSLTDLANDRKIITLSLSADKLTSVSNYTREPRRLEFECLADDWINQNLLSGTMEFGCYVSKFEVRAYRDGTLMFTGFPDTSLLALDYATQIIKITCYDRIKLLSLFSDLEFSYNFPQGYLPWWIVGYFMQGIQLQLPVPVQQLYPFTLPFLHQNDLTLCRLDYTYLEQLPPASGSIGNINGWRRYRFDDTSWHYPRYGWILDTSTGLATFVFAHKKVLVCEGGNGYAAYSCRAKYRAKVWRFFNNLCPVITEYDEKTSWVSSLNDLEDANDDLPRFSLGCCWTWKT